MFSKDWFVYVFGRWLLLSGISGALVQFLFADIFRIPTIPAFLLNQFCLACVFWYVDKLIFKRHLANSLLNLFRFPRIRCHHTYREQLNKVEEEFREFRDRLKSSPDQPEAWLNEFVDLVHATEMMERILREHSVALDLEFERVRKENSERKLY